MSDETKASPATWPIEKLVSAIQRAILGGTPVPIALAALETHVANREAATAERLRRAVEPARRLVALWDSGDIASHDMCTQKALDDMGATFEGLRAFLAEVDKP